MEDIKRGDRMNRNLQRPLLLTAAMLALSGCGGGGSGGSNSVDTSPGGVFSADVTTNTPKLALVTEAGAGWLYDDATDRAFRFTLDVAHAVAQADGSAALSGTITSYDGSSGAALSSGTLQATVKGHAGPLTLSYTLGSGSGNYNLTYSSFLYQQPSMLSLVVGSYAPGASKGSAQLASASIDAAGNFSASDAAGCSYAGTVAVVDPVYNAYQINGITQSGGGACSATGLSGQAVVIPAAPATTSTPATPQQLTFSIANANQQLISTLIRH